MSYKSNVIYYYDGTFDGLMCCVFESVYEREEPIAIEIIGHEQSTLFSVKEIYTDEEKAMRVKKSIPKKIGLEAKEMVEEAYLSCMENKELKILEFLKLGYKTGSKVCSMLTTSPVTEIKKANLFLSREAHLFTGFIRFSEFDGVLLSVINPKNNVLPLISEHFCDRFSGETFMIFDKTHKVALVYKDGKAEYKNVDDIKEPPLGPEEKMYRSMWKKFFDTIGIKERLNRKCQMSHLPLRYRSDMNEFS